MTRSTLLALAAAVLLSGCSGDSPEPSPVATSVPTDAPSPPAPDPGPDAPSAAPTTASASAPTTGAPAPERSAPPPFRADVRPDTAEPSGGPLTVVGVRAARQDGYDRVVFELRGTEPGVPGWRVRYVERARQDGSGRPVAVAGAAVLEVAVLGVGYPFDTGQTETSRDLMPTDTRVVREVDLQATYEGAFQAFVGVTARRPFRVFRLRDPARVVVDVRHR